MKKVNPRWKDKLQVYQENGVTVISGNLTVSGLYAEEMAANVNGVWRGATGSYDGVLYRSDISMTAVSSGGDWQVVWMRRQEWVELSLKSCGFQVGGRNEFGSSKMELGHGDWRSGFTAAHEFGHAMGLSHAPQGSGSIRSYDSLRVVKGRDLYNIATSYRH